MSTILSWEELNGDRSRNEDGVLVCSHRTNFPVTAGSSGGISRFLGYGCFPEPHCPVLTAQGQGLAVAAERHGPDRAGVSLEGKAVAFAKPVVEPPGEIAQVWWTGVGLLQQCQ